MGKRLAILVLVGDLTNVNSIVEARTRDSKLLTGFGRREVMFEQSKNVGILTYDDIQKNAWYKSAHLCITMEKFWSLRKSIVQKARHNKHFKKNQYQFSRIRSVSRGKEKKRRRKIGTPGVVEYDT